VPILAKESPVWVAESSGPDRRQYGDGGRGGHGLRLCRTSAPTLPDALPAATPLAPAAALGSEVRPRCTAS